MQDSLIVYIYIVRNIFVSRNDLQEHFKIIRCTVSLQLFPSRTSLCGYVSLESCHFYFYHIGISSFVKGSKFNIYYIF